MRPPVMEMCTPSLKARLSQELCLTPCPYYKLSIATLISWTILNNWKYHVVHICSDKIGVFIIIVYLNDLASEPYHCPQPMLCIHLFKTRAYHVFAGRYRLLCSYTTINVSFVSIWREATRQDMLWLDLSTRSIRQIGTCYSIVVDTYLGIELASM